MNLGASPFFEALDAAENVLIAGAGGGFDIYSGLPLFFWRHGRGKRTHLANLSFVNVAALSGRCPSPTCVEVTASTKGPDGYFPEGALVRWLFSVGVPQPVYAFEKTGAKPLRAAYEALQRELGFDAVVLVDGGTDILMRGDEAGVGTPGEDITSLAAVAGLSVPKKWIACLGFGVDRHHGVCHAQFLENTAALSREGAFLGATSLLPQMPEVDRFREAIQYATATMPSFPSIVSWSVLSAVEGEFGDVHKTARTQGSKLFINPLMSMYWAYDLAAVARRCLYLDAVSQTENLFQVNALIEGYRSSHPTKPWVDIPL